MKREFGVEKEQILHTAQSLTHDLLPAKEMGMSGAWIDREDEEEKYQDLKEGLNFTWRFKTLGEMAEAVEEAFGKAK